ncbi:cutinase [Rhodococcus sp. 05-2254-6]|uniref:Cutinase family protein n=2 Tax=Nocardiaceae TaxID=85025 RepID=A0ABU4B0M9_9NOCA|nr:MULTISPECIES: cutinase family protein [Rhodococcus]MDV6232042.1 cutinase family protein [Rhodococcus cercidiphylli]OZE24567.1 cutinase [Rhodococcus sp. 05-2254-6]OZE42181.1 cutinase [Rhodococcus sp. 05-2254-4]OZE49889.1 cutinase [Rhodococcus sp. 05-2254-3]OZE50527.1 cutinase [Rhodococcus sp. 05-2254-2]
MNVGKSKRARVALSAFAIGALGAGVVVAAPWSTPSTTTEASIELVSTATCYDMVSIAIGGRGDTPREGVKWLTTPEGERLPAAMSGDYSSDWIDQAVRAPNNGNVVPDSYAAVYVEYPADLASYENAVQTGVTNSQTIMRTISASCPDTRFAIVGYSEGADVARRTAMEVGNQVVSADGTYGIVDPNQVVGVVIFADAGRVSGDGPFPGAENPFGNPDGFDTKYQNGNTAVPGQGALPGTSGGFGALDGRVASFCSDGDLTCALPENTSLIHLAANVGRQVNADALQNEQLTPATGADLALALGRIAVNAFNDIASQPNWMQSDETFLDVLIKVSEPGYKPGTVTTPVSAKVDGEQEPIETGQMIDLVYLPQKIFREITGFISSNQNTVPVIMNDPYGLTLGPGTGHHFDYWRDADAANGKPLTSVQYAAAWLTELAEEANRGEPVKTKEVQEKAGRAAVETIVAPVTTSATATPKATTTAPVTTSPVVTPAAPAAPAPAAESPAPAPAPATETATTPECTVAVEGETPAEGAPPVCVTATETAVETAPETVVPTTTEAVPAP